MTSEEALRNILSLVDGSDELEDVHALQILLQSIKTLAGKRLGRSEESRSHDCSSGRYGFAPRAPPVFTDKLILWSGFDLGRAVST